MKIDPKVAAIIADSRVYLAKPNTANLANFADFVVAIAGEDYAKLSVRERSAFLAGVRAAGLYSRYQRANANRLAEAVIATGRATRATAERRTRTAKPETVGGSGPAVPAES
jgi:hypothetical protein